MEVSAPLLNTLKKLQNLPSLKQFALGGGTNLALRFKHRISIDIDLFCTEIIGRKGFENIEKELKEFFGKSVLAFTYPCNENDQFIFARCLILSEGETIKIELLQNFKLLYPIEFINGTRMCSLQDIGIFKLISLANRSANKDVYDLDFITDEIPLIELYKSLIKKQEKYNAESDKNIFDLDNTNPNIKPELLLSFDIASTENLSRPSHSDDRIVVLEGNKNWLSARTSWKTKVRDLIQVVK
ncbi:MAG: nucleotidyl transferase AbiEii/AbiGii toxin family protein [Flavobacteriales bacterium]|nr:nucleotidyl transferase AbiEii/AbiGii toxin family protein [Flavobacteriales bacterium]